MPYIKPEARVELDTYIDKIVEQYPQDVSYEDIWRVLCTLLGAKQDISIVLNQSVMIEMSSRLGAVLAIRSVGDLNYSISRLIWELWFQREISYTKIDTIVGLLDRLIKQFPKCSSTLRCVQFEIYRRLAANYENEKMNTHGDVFINNKIL